MRHGALRIGAVSAFAALATLASCRDATEVTLVLSTDVPCTQVTGTSITVGTGAEVDMKDSLTETNHCDKNNPNTIGTFVLIPSGSSDASFAVRILTAVGGSIGTGL